jgi:hypothetical protein
MSNILNNTTSLQEVLEALKTKAAGEQATPVITVNSSTGLITATAGTKSATQQLAFQPAKTITPSATSQVAISSGYYTGGDVTVAGDANLVADNIVSGKSIFGVVGTATSGGGGETNYKMEDSLVTRNMTSYENDRVSTVGDGAFIMARTLSKVDFPNATVVGASAFASCSSLKSVSFPACTSIGSYAFAYCSSLTNISFPACANIGDSAFTYCSSLANISFPVCTSIGSYAFAYCRYLNNINFPTCVNIGNNAF